MWHFPPVSVWNWFLIFWDLLNGPKLVTWESVFSTCHFWGRWFLMVPSFLSFSPSKGCRCFWRRFLCAEGGWKVNSPEIREVFGGNLGFLVQNVDSHSMCLYVFFIFNRFFCMKHECIMYVIFVHWWGSKYPLATAAIPHPQVGFGTDYAILLFTLGTWKKRIIDYLQLTLAHSGE